MTEVILNDECMHCSNRECHDGEHFCNQAMKDNSFYKNPKLYKGLEVVQRPTYEELEKENAELKEKLNIRSCQNCKHNNKSCPSDGSCKNYSKWQGFENPQEHTDLWNELCEQAEQFFKRGGKMTKGQLIKELEVLMMTLLSLYMIMIPIIILSALRIRLQALRCRMKLLEFVTKK